MTGPISTRLAALVDPDRPITYGIVQPGPDVPDGIPYIRVVDLAGGQVSVDKLRRTSAEIARAYRRSSVIEGDILVSIRGHVGRTAFVPQGAHGANLTQDTARVAVATGTDSGYIRWFLESPVAARWMAERTKGVAVTGINLGDLRELPVPVRPLEEQRRIADILDKADAIRRKRKEAIALTEALVRSTFLEMFGDPVTNPEGWPLAALTDICQSKQYGTAEKANAERIGLPVLRMGNLTYAGEIELDDLKWVQLSTSEAAKLDLREGDVLFNRVNSPSLVGKTAAWHGGDGYTFAGYLIRLRMHPSLATGDYVSAAMNMPSLKARILAMAKPSINMANISGSDLARLSLPLPPLAEQRTFGEFLARMRGLRRGYFGAAATSDALFNSLVHRAFSGQLT